MGPCEVNIQMLSSKMDVLGPTLPDLILFCIFISSYPSNTHTHTNVSSVAPGDYGVLNNFRLGSFNNSVRRLSFNVSINLVNDNIPGDDKMFSASLTLYPADRQSIGNCVTLSPDVATVTIQDNDGKQL